MSPAPAEDGDGGSAGGGDPGGEPGRRNRGRAGGQDGEGDAAENGEDEGITARQVMERLLRKLSSLAAAAVLYRWWDGFVEQGAAEAMYWRCARPCRRAGEI